MKFIPLLLLAILIALAGPAAAQSGRSTKPATKAKKNPTLDVPMVFYVAKGEADACGPGCSEWIAAEGSFDFGAARRLRAFLTRLGKRKLPIYFHSPGGLGNAAMTMGRLLREREMTAGVSQTIPAGCETASVQACRALKRSGKAIAAELRDVAVCASACVYAFIGAKERQVPPGARLGVHSGKLVLVHPDGRTKSPSAAKLSSYQKARSREFDGQLRRYVQEMKIDAGLFDLSTKIPHEKVHFLSRDEIARFGIDTREFSETRWIAIEQQSKQLSTMKFVVEARGATRKEFRASMIQAECAGPQQITLVYVRGLGSDEIAATRTVRLVVEGRSVSLFGSGNVTKIDAIDTGGSFNIWFASQSFDFFDAAAARETVEFVEADSAGATTRTTKLSTAGLSQAIAKLRQRCTVPPFTDAGTAGRVPYLDNPHFKIDKRPSPARKGGNL